MIKDFSSISFPNKNLVSGRPKYQATKLTGGPHNHPEKYEKVLLDFARHQLKVLVAERQEWRRKTYKQIYTDFVQDFSSNLDEEKKSLFFVVFPPYQAIETMMIRWKRSTKNKQLT